MSRVHILSICSHCYCEAGVPGGEAMSSKAETYARYIPCPMCEGSGNEAKWIDREDFAKLLQQAVCQMNIHPTKAVCISVLAMCGMT
jgi:hypothetical protein